MDTTLSKLSQGTVRENQRFMIVAKVKEEAFGAFTDATKIMNLGNKFFILCGCQLKDSPHMARLYLSNDPNDFINNNVATANNYGVIPFSYDGNSIKLDLLNKNHNRTLYLPEDPDFDPLSNDQPTDYYFYSNNILFPNNRLQYGVPFTITIKNNETKNFFIRKNLTNGKIGPSIAWFSQPSQFFEYAKTKFFGAYGTSLDFTFDADKLNMLGISRLNLDTNSEPFSSLPATYNSGIVKINQGTSTWYNVFNNSSGVSDIHLGMSSGDFLNTTVYQPGISQGISVQINIRNDEENFVSIPSLDIPLGTEVFHYTLVNLNGFISGGGENDSSQYQDTASNISSGLCYFLDTNYTYHNFFRQKNMSGAIHALNVMNGTENNSVNTDINKKTSKHAQPYTVFSDHYDSLYAIDLNAHNSFNTDDQCGKVRTITQFRNNICGLYLDSDLNLNDPNGKIFTNNSKTNQKTYLIEIIIMAVLMIIYIIFAFYYFNMELV